MSCCWSLSQTVTSDAFRQLSNFRINIPTQQPDELHSTTEQWVHTSDSKDIFQCNLKTLSDKESGYATVVHGRPKTPKNTSFWGVTQPPGVAEPLYSRGHN